MQSQAPPTTVFAIVAVASLIAPIVWAVWLRRRVPGPMARRIPWFVAIAIAGPALLGFVGSARALLMVSHAIGQVNPADKAETMSLAMSELFEGARRHSLVALPLYGIAIALLAVLTVVYFARWRSPTERDDRPAS